MQKVKGTKDIYGFELQIYNKIFSIFDNIAKNFRIKQVISPIFEYSEVFMRSIGDQTDIVEKELYTFLDKSNRSISLRPEGTASLARLIKENKLDINNEYEKLYYKGKMFRYEKPQKGRLREFYQIGFEYYRGDLYSLVETIYIANQFLKQINIDNFDLKINNISSLATRNKYKKDLSKYFLKNKDKLSDKQILKIENNPFRILDDKEFDFNSFKDLPTLNDYYTQDEKQLLKDLSYILDLLNIKYTFDLFLVRGLDYYSNIVFEFVSKDSALGAKLTIIGGGQYQNLLDNKDLSAVGFAIGVERVFEILLKREKQDLKNDLDLYIIFSNQQDLNSNQNLIFDLFNQGINFKYNKSIKTFNKLFKEAIKTNPKYLLLKENNNWILKNKDQKINIELSNLVSILKGE